MPSRNGESQFRGSHRRVFVLIDFCFPWPSKWCPAGKLLPVVFLLVLTFVSSPVSAQVGFRPADEAPKSPDLKDEKTEARDSIQWAPRLEKSVKTSTRGLEIRPRGFSVTGCTAFGEEELATFFAPYVDRPLGTLDLLSVVDDLRTLYGKAGYATTQVVLPDQDLSDGRVELRVLEGAVSEIVIRGTLHLRNDFVRARMERASRAPLDVRRLERHLERLQADGAIEHIAATLEEVGPARHRLILEIRETAPFSFRARASNHRSPSIGSIGSTLEFSKTSLLGFGDRLRIGGQFSEGVRDALVSWSGPISVLDTRLSIAYRRGRAEIVERNFEKIDIEGRFESATVGLEHPVYRGREWEAWMGLQFDWRRSASSILGSVESFQADLTDRTPSASILRWRGDLRWREKRRGAALRSTISIGLPVFGATEEGDAGNRDGEFVSGLLQLQFSQLLPEIERMPFFDGSQLLLRGDFQISSDPLLSFEQIAVGGARTVRGFRQNQIVRDSGAVVGVEVRVPLLRTGFDRPVVELAPFVDYGSAWDRRRGRSSDESLLSMGAALYFAPTEKVHASLSWAHRFRSDLVRGDPLQRNGFYFEVAWDVF